MQRNRMSGSLPSQLGNLAYRWSILTLLMPGNLRLLTLLDVSFNSFGGVVPSSFCNLANNPNVSIFLCSAAALTSNDGCGAISAVPSCLYPNSPSHHIGNLTEYPVVNITTIPTIYPSISTFPQNLTMCSLASAWNISGWTCSAAGLPVNLCSHWTGITCNGSVVVAISLVFYDIVGSIPITIGNALHSSCTCLDMLKRKAHYRT